MDSDYENFTSTIISWILEPAIFIATLYFLIEMFQSYSQKMDELSTKLWDITQKCKKLCDHLDYEFDLIKKCSKSVDEVNFDYESFYKAINNKQENNKKEDYGLGITEPNIRMIITRTLSDTIVSTRVESLKNLFAGIKYISLKKPHPHARIQTDTQSEPTTKKELKELTEQKMPEITLSEISLPNSIMTLGPESLNSEGSFFVV